MEFIALKEEIVDDYKGIENKLIEVSKNASEEIIQENLEKLQKKCGEIFIRDEDIFSFLCTLCETPFDEIDCFFVHYKNTHSMLCVTEKTKSPEINVRTNQFKVTKIEPDLEASRKRNENVKLVIHSENVCDLSVSPAHVNHIEQTEENKKESKKRTTQTVKRGKTTDYSGNSLYSSNKSLRRGSRKRNISCDARQKKFTTKKAIDKHKNLNLNQNVCVESISVETENENLNMNDGKNIEQGKVAPQLNYDDPLKCRYCDRRMGDSSTLLEHERIHTGERPYQCQICGKQFRTRSCLCRHEKIHSNVRHYKCEKCNMSFKSRAGLCAHKLRHGEKKISCSYCDKLFHSKAAKIEHERVHTGEKPYLCNFCGKCFQTSGRLNTHSRTHTGIKPYKCQQCDRCFATKAVLDNHVVIHTGERPFVCQTCDATFPRKKALKSHEKIHSDYRGYVCRICGEAFKQYPTLHGHMKSHRKVLTKSKRH